MLVCRFFNTPGGCRNGQCCTYIHDREARAICTHYFKSFGKCKWGDRCHFKHELDVRAGDEYRNVTFLRPDGDAEQKTVAWCKTNGCFEVSPGKWSGDWYDKVHRKKQEENLSTTDPMVMLEMFKAFALSRNDSNSDGESDADDCRVVRFLRPDGDTELKTVAWCECNGFFEVSPGYWSGDWYDEVYGEKIKTDDTDVPSANAKDADLAPLPPPRIKMQLRFDCEFMKRNANQWKFRRLTKDEQQEYDRREAESRQEDQYDFEDLHSVPELVLDSDWEQKSNSESDSDIDADEHSRLDTNSALLNAAKNGHVKVVRELLVNSGAATLSSSTCDAAFKAALKKSKEFDHILAIIDMVNKLWIKKKLNPSPDSIDKALEKLELWLFNENAQ